MLNWLFLKCLNQNKFLNKLLREFWSTTTVFSVLNRLKQTLTLMRLKEIFLKFLVATDLLAPNNWMKHQFGMWMIKWELQSNTVTHLMLRWFLSFSRRTISLDRTCGLIVSSGHYQKSKLASQFSETTFMVTLRKSKDRADWLFGLMFHGHSSETDFKSLTRTWKL